MSEKKLLPVLCNDIPLMLPSPPLSCIALQSNVEGRDSRLLHPCRAKLSSTTAVEWQKSFRIGHNCP